VFSGFLINDDIQADEHIEFMNPASKLIRIKKRLLFKLEVISNALLDRLLGVHTHFIQTPNSTSIEQAVLERAQRYHAANYHSIVRALWFLKRSGGGKTLVDLGCGAGRVLIVAAIFGYRDLTGVEIDESLIQNAESNLRRFFGRFRISRNVSIVHQSASEHLLADETAVVFLFNPFDDWIFERFLTLNHDSLIAGKLTFVCVNPRLGYMIEQRGFSLIKEWAHEDFSRKVSVYRKLRNPG
jgi:SAM-dependent methyltransferase